LRRELETRGHQFHTSSDTESIVHAYEEWGGDAFRRLRGMFGLAIWDEPRRTLLLARDRAGIKPLHYVERDGRLYFGSEIKSLLAAGAVDQRLNFEALDHYLFSEKVAIEDVSREKALFVLAGPQARATSERLTGARPPENPWSHVVATLGDRCADQSPDQVRGRA